MHDKYSRYLVEYLFMGICLLFTFSWANYLYLRTIGHTSVTVCFAITTANGVVYHGAGAAGYGVGYTFFFLG